MTCNLAKDRFVEKVDYITSPGFLKGEDSRVQAGIRWGGPEAVVTERGGFRFDSMTKEIYLAEFYPGNSVGEIRSLIPWELRVAETVHTINFSEEEIALIRSRDPLNIFLGSKSVTKVEDFASFYELMRAQH